MSYIHNPTILLSQAKDMFVSRAEFAALRSTVEALLNQNRQQDGRPPQPIAMRLESYNNPETANARMTLDETRRNFEIKQIEKRVLEHQQRSSDQMNTLQSRLESISVSVERNDHSIRALDSRYNHLTTDELNQRSAWRSQKPDITTLKSDVTALQSDVTTIRKDLAAIKDSLNKPLASENVGIVEQISRMKKEQQDQFEKIGARLQDVEKTNQELRSKIKKLKGRFKAARDKMTGKLGTVVNQFSHLKEELKGIRAENYENKQQKYTNPEADSPEAEQQAPRVEALPETRRSTGLKRARRTTLRMTPVTAESSRNKEPKQPTSERKILELTDLPMDTTGRYIEEVIFGAYTAKCLELKKASNGLSLSATVEVQGVGQTQWEISKKGDQRPKSIVEMGNFASDANVITRSDVEGLQIDQPREDPAADTIVLDLTSDHSEAEGSKVTAQMTAKAGKRDNGGPAPRPGEDYLEKWRGMPTQTTRASPHTPLQPQQDPLTSSVDGSSRKRKHDPYNNRTSNQGSKLNKRSK